MFTNEIELQTPNVKKKHPLPPTQHKKANNRAFTDTTQKKMRILTHNMMVCLKCDHFPLTIKATNKSENEQEENLDFIKHMLSKLDYSALKSAANDLEIAGLPDTLPDNVFENTAALQSLHKLLMEVVVVDGELVCPNCQRIYPVKNKIPNMVLREDEVLEKKKSSASSTSNNNNKKDELDLSSAMNNSTNDEEDDDEE